MKKIIFLFFVLYLATGAVAYAQNQAYGSDSGTPSGVSAQNIQQEVQAPANYSNNNYVSNNVVNKKVNNTVVRRYYTSITRRSVVGVSRRALNNETSARKWADKKIQSYIKDERQVRLAADRQLGNDIATVGATADAAYNAAVEPTKKEGGSSMSIAGYILIGIIAAVLVWFTIMYCIGQSHNRAAGVAAAVVNARKALDNTQNLKQLDAEELLKNHARKIDVQATEYGLNVNIRADQPAIGPWATGTMIPPSGGHGGGTGGTPVMFGNGTVAVTVVGGAAPITYNVPTAGTLYTWNIPAGATSIPAGATVTLPGGSVVVIPATGGGLLIH